MKLLNLVVVFLLNVTEMKDGFAKKARIASCIKKKAVV